MKIIIKMPNTKSQIEMYFGSKVSANKNDFLPRLIWQNRSVLDSAGLEAPVIGYKVLLIIKETG